MVLKITEEVESDITKIVKVAKRLNAQADEATEYIVQIEDRLNIAKVGKVVWLDSTEPRIGFAKIEGKWGIAVSDPDRLLKKADRATRIAAVSLIPKLLKLIAETLTT